MVLVVLLLACANTSGFGGSGGGSRIEGMSGSLGGSGGGDTTTTDTGGDEPTDTTETGFTTTTTSGCGPSDLSVSLEARGSDGVASQYFGTGEAIDVVATFTNGCADDITVRAAEDCFVDTWTLEGDNGTGSDASIDCDSGSVTLSSGQSVENRYELGTLSLGGYTVTADSTATNLSIYTSFTVQ